MNPKKKRRIYERHRFYFHGTTKEAALQILKSNKLSVCYFDEIGIYLTDSVQTAMNFGPYVFWITGIKERNLQEDDTNDGFFYPEEIQLDSYIILRYSVNGQGEAESQSFDKLNRLLAESGRSEITRESYHKNIDGVRFELRKTACNL